MPFTFQVAIFIPYNVRNYSPLSEVRIITDVVRNSGLRAFDHLQLVVDALHAVDLGGELRGARALAGGGDCAPQADLALGGGDVDRPGGQLGVGRLERGFDA